MDDEFSNVSKEEIDALLNSESMVRFRAFREAEQVARKAAGCDGTAGRVEFICPHCGKNVVSDFYPHRGELHGGVFCETCQIGLRI